MCDSLIHAELADTTSGGWPPECNWQVEPGPPGCRVPRLPDPGVRVKGDIGAEPGMSMSFLTINPPSDSRRAAEAGNDIRRTVTGREAWRSTVVRTCAHEGVGGHLQPISDISPSSCHGCSHLLGGGSLRWSSGYAITNASRAADAKAGSVVLLVNAPGAAAVKVLSRPAREPIAEMSCVCSEPKESRRQKDGRMQHWAE